VYTVYTNDRERFFNKVTLDQYSIQMTYLIQFVCPQKSQLNTRIHLNREFEIFKMGAPAWIENKGTRS